MFKKIVSDSNLEAAYLKIIDQFAIDRKTFTYHGLDNLLLKDYDFTSRGLIALARSELIEKKELEPALALKIPKRNNPERFREIFIYNIKERLKAQAIFQVLLPEFEIHFSDRLFSYRPGRPPYIAAKNFARRYRRNFKMDHALILDLERYSDLIDKQILLSRLRTVFHDREILDLLGLFIFNRVYREGVIETPERGLVQGVPLIGMFANLYLSDMDFKYQAAVPFYIRVGDDIALMDRRPEKLLRIKDDLAADLAGRRLAINEYKAYLGPAGGRFSFLGYEFDNGLISLERSFVTKTEMDWKRILVYKNMPDRKKDRLLERIMREPRNNYNARFDKIIKDKPQINNSDQIRRLSEGFWHILTRFLYRSYSPRNRRLLEERTKGLRIRSLYNHYAGFHYERDKKTD
jgi:retron-type reverse transcriptase